MFNLLFAPPRSVRSIHSSRIIYSIPSFINSPSTTDFDKPVHNMNIKISTITGQSLLNGILLLNDKYLFLDNYGNIKPDLAIFLSIRVLIGGSDGGWYTLFSYLRFNSQTLDNIVEDLLNEFSDSDEFYRTSLHLRVNLFGWVTQILSDDIFISSRQLLQSSVIPK
ncbi:hypothetical protein HK096_008491 [Nowakowskiella sp. JEL0078]|nr:hypothetical protein HK096_008491 [Nowakowskiella sp. JEL0078]